MGFLIVVGGILLAVASNATKARAYLCVFCRMRYAKELEASRITHPLAAALYALLRLPEPGFRGDVTDADRALVAVEAAITARLGLATLRGWPALAIADLASRVHGLFVVDGEGHPRFPPRRLCWLLAPRAVDVIAKLGA